MTVCRFDDDDVDKDGLVRFQIERRPRGHGESGGASLLRTRTRSEVRLVISILIVVVIIIVIIIMIGGDVWRLTVTRRMTRESRRAECCFASSS